MRTKTRFRKFTAWLLTLAMLITFVPSFTLTASAAESYSYPTSKPTPTWTGSGTEANPYVITTAQQLADLAWLINNANSSYYSKYYKLGNDIDLSSGTWEPIGYRDASDKAGFKGTFDGNSKTVSGLNVVTTHKTAGLFGYLEGGTIKNLTVSGEYTSTNAYAGGVCAMTYYRSSSTSIGSTIENCVNNVKISFTSTSSANVCAGGIVGSAGPISTIKNCVNNGTVTTSTDGTSTYVGGIVGLFSGGSNNMENCENTAAITHTGTSGKVGGICGYFNGNKTTSFIKNCKNLGSVSGTTDVGGIVGRGKGIIERCSNTAAIAGTKKVGGISGCTQAATITKCFNTGNVTGSIHVGGISGYSDSGSVIEICYNTGIIKSTNTTSKAEVMVGGIEGYTYGTTVNNCYNLGTVQGSSSTCRYVGGISGRLTNNGTVENSFNFGTVSIGDSTYKKAIAYKTSGTITNCYFLSSDGTDENATGKSSTEFSDGTVCNLLQAGNLELIWGQTIGTDTHPVFYNGSNSLGVDATGVTVAPTTATIGTGNTTSSVTLVATVSPVNANVKTVTWTSSDDTVATVIDGVVTAVSKGTATITATSTEGGFTATCEVTVCDHVGSTHTEYTCANRQHTYTCTLCNLDVTVDCTIDTATGNCTVCGTNVTAVNVTVGDSTTYYKELGTAIAYVNTLSGSEKVFVKLVADSTYDEIITLPARIMELDLNGNIASVKNLVYISGTDLTVKDTSASQDGELCIISGDGGGVYTNVVYGAKLTLESGTIDGSVKHTIDGTFVMTGGTIQGFWAVYVNSATASVTITGGTAEGTDQKGLCYGSGFTGANVSISGGTFVNGIETPDGMTISDLLADKCDAQDANGVSYAESSYTMETLYVIYVHTHEWTYTSSGDTITATCANTDGRCGDAEQSITINAPSKKNLAFNNTNKAATISGTIEGVELPEIVYTQNGEAATPFAPGAYEASITLGTATASCGFEITKGRLTSSNFNYTAPANLTYDGTPKVATVVPKDDYASYIGNVEVLYGGTAMAPTDVGNYMVTVNVTESDYYSAASNLRLGINTGFRIVAKTITITGATIEDLLYNESGNYTLNVTGVTFDDATLILGTDYTVVAELTGSNEVANNVAATVTVTLNNTNYQLSADTFNGTVNIVDHTHVWSYELDGTNTIKATCTASDCPNTSGGSVTIAAPDSLVYTGSAIEAKVTNTLTTGDTVSVVYTPADKLTDGKPVIVGTYTATITIDDVSVSVGYSISGNLSLNTNGGTINSGNLEYYNEGETTTLPTDVTKDGCVFDGWYENEDLSGEKVTVIAATETGIKTYYAKWIEEVTFAITDTEHTYETGTKREISFTPSALTKEDYEVKYYLVNENSGVLYSIEPETKAITAGKYLYVIDFKEAQTGYVITDKFEVTSTALPDIENYDNVGYMLITSGAETAQKPIFFEKQTVNAKMTDTVTNPLTNPNASSVTYESSDGSVATVDNSGNITIVGAGSTVIVATSTKENSSDVYASYTLNVTKEVVTVTANNKEIFYGDDFANDGYTVSKDGVILSGTPDYTTDYVVGDGVGKYEINVSGLSSNLYEIEYKSGTLKVNAKELTADDFDVDVKNKTYDGSDKAEVTATVKNESLVSGDVVTVLASGTFDKKTVDASKVNYTISGLSGKDSSNYVLKNEISGNIEASITKAKVTVSVPNYTSYVYDGDGKSVSVFAYANGIYFDKFKVTYGGSENLPTDKGTYAVGIAITDGNYELDGTIDATLEIKSAQQDVFSIEGISGTVTYGDVLPLQTAGAIEGGSVSYEITSGGNYATLDADNKITAKGVGTVTVTATSKKANYADKTATRTFVIKPKTISVTAEATNRVYDGTKNVDVTLTPVGVLSGDSVTVTKTSATVATADVETGKTVFVSGLSIIDNANYQLAATSVQTTVNITKRTIGVITATADGKVYDGTKAVTGYTIEIPEYQIVSADKNFLNVSADAEFNAPEVGPQTVTFKNLILSGTKSGNYKLGMSEVSNTASITQATVNFELGTLSYVYDGKAKTVPVTATVGGKAFDGYTVTYKQGDQTIENPTDAGTYDVEITLKDSKNYKSDYTTTQKLVITTADQSAMTITGLLGTIEYGKTFGLNAVGGSGDISATWESSDTDIATVDGAGVVTIKGVGEEVTITATKAANGNFNKQTASVTFTPVKKNVTFKITNLNQVYDGNAKAATITTAAGVTSSVKYFNENNQEVANPTNAGTYYVEATATGNYEGEQSAVLTIKKARRNTDSISLAIPDNIVYGNTYDVTVNGYDGNDGTITYTGTGLYGGQTEKPTNAGNYTATLTISNDNYETATVKKGFEIKKATLYAKPDNKSRAYGEQNPVFTIKYYSDSACENEVTNADVMITPVMSTTATASATVGNYDICASGGYAENYKLEYVNGTLAIGTATGGNFYISGGNANPYVGNKFTLTAYYNNERPTVEWSSSAPEIAKVDKATGEVEIIGTGEAVITATMKDSRFDNNLTATFKLTAARLPENQNAIIFETPIVEKFANDEDFTINPTNVSDGATVKYKSSNEAVATVDESTGKVTIKKVGTVVITATATKFNCPDVYASYTLSIKKIPVTITADNKTITYGEAFNGTATFSNDLTASDFDGTLGFNTRYTVGKDVDEYDVTPTGLTSDKYDITFVSGTITVTEKTLTKDDFIVTAENKAYDGTKDVEISASVKDSAVVGNDKLYVEISGSFENANVGTGKTVNYDIISLSGRGFENYTLDGTTGLTTTANIDKAEVTFFVSEETVKNYDGKAQNVEISAMANGNVFGSENYTVYYQKDSEEKTTTPTNVGEYTVSVELNDSDNYTVKDFTAKLKIEQDADVELTIKGSNKNVTVGDVFTLYAQYGNDKADVEWNSSDESVATVDKATGEVTILKSGDVKITATMKDTNYAGLSADFDLTAAKKRITLSASATELVKVYNGKVQNITFTAGSVNLDDITINTSYVMTTDSSKQEPKDVGTYAVSYTIDDERYEGDGNLTLVINKATVTVSTDTIEKEYGEEPEYKLIVSDNVEGINAETMKEFVTITSDGAAKTANVGEYDINVELAKTSDDNCNYVVYTEANGKLNVTPANLTVNVADITREYGAQNPTERTYTIDGFKNDETADILTGSIAPVYAETIKEKVGTQKDVVTALSTLANGNYKVEVKYVDGDGADLTITKIAVKASAGTSRASYLTVKFDKAVEGVTFKVTDSNGDVEVTSVTASSDNKTYTLNGTFTVGTEYTVEITYDNATQEITEGKTLTITPSKSSSGGGGGGGSSTPTSYTVTFETNGGSKVDSVKVEKNKTVTEPTAPTKDGFEFDGWYTDKKLTTEYDFDTKVTKAITLYAKWTEKKADDNKDDSKDDNNNPTPSEWKNPFTDVKETDWFFDNVRYANENGLMSGTSDTEFAPNDTLTRGMLVTVLYRAEGEPAVNKSIPFADVNASQYYANAVIWAEQNDIVNGVTEAEFAPDENITREQIATIIYRYAQYKGIAPTGAWAIKLDYADVAEISDYAVDGVMYCTMKNIMQGKDNNMFAPKDNATRAEIAAILNRFIEGNK